MNNKLFHWHDIYSGSYYHPEKFSREVDRLIAQTFDYVNSHPTYCRYCGSEIRNSSSSVKFNLGSNEVSYPSTYSDSTFYSCSLCGWYFSYTAAQEVIFDTYSLNVLKPLDMDFATEIEKELIKSDKMNNEQISDLAIKTLKNNNFDLLVNQESAKKDSRILVFDNKSKNKSAVVEQIQHQDHIEVIIPFAITGIVIDWDLRRSYLITSNEDITKSKGAYRFDLDKISEITRVLGIYNETLPPLTNITPNIIKDIENEIPARKFPSQDDQRNALEAHLKTLIHTHKRRVRVLEQQKAFLGIAADPAIIMEIEDIQEAILRLEESLEKL